MILIFFSSILFIIWLGDFMTRADIFLSIKICFSRHQELLYLPLEDLLHQQVPVHCLLVHVWAGVSESVSPATLSAPHHNQHQLNAKGNP